MPRPFVMWPDPRLKSVAEPVTQIDDQIHAIWAEMLEAMYAMPGLGLAAPQLGIGLRLAVVDCGQARQPVRLANPKITWAANTLRPWHEASPNLPGLSAEIQRPAPVRVAYLDENGSEVEREFSDLWATSVQHQIDHLDGKLFIDRLSRLKRQRLLDKHRADLKRRKRKA
ncbi:MAG: peptide deformylase [Pseudomonadota bacterium]